MIYLAIKGSGVNERNGRNRKSYGKIEAKGKRKNNKIQKFIVEIISFELPVISVTIKRNVNGISRIFYITILLLNT